MKLNELRNETVLRSMPMGRNTVTFTKIEYRENNEGDVDGAWVHIKEYRPLFLPIFEENNYQLDLLTAQLEVESYSDLEINKKAGTKIVAHKYRREDEKRQQTYTNISFNAEYKEATNQMSFA